MENRSVLELVIELNTFGELVIRMGSGIKKQALGSFLKISGVLDFTNVKFVYNVKSDNYLLKV